MRRLSSTALLLAFACATLAGCTAPEPAATQTLAPAFRIPPGDPRLPAGSDGLLQGEAAPFPVFGATVNVTTQANSARETSLAVSRDGKTLFACEPSGVPALSSGHSFFALSTDGGQSWGEVDVEDGMADPRRATFEGGDCDTAIDEAGTLYAADTWLGGLSLGASRDNGATWSGIPVAGGAPVVDRPWLVGGPAGTVWVTYQDIQFGMPTAIWFTKSTDYGATFSPPVSVAVADPEKPLSWEGNLAVAPGGQDLYLVFTRRPADTLDPTGLVAPATYPETLFLASSHDGGATWANSLLSERPAPASYLYPSLAVDAAGGLHVAFSQPDGEEQPIWYAHSADQGRTWSGPVKLLAGIQGYSPWIAAGAAGQAIAVWYGCPDPAARFSQSADWFLYWARIDVSGGNASVQAGRTTPEPVFHGRQGDLRWAEFNMVRLDGNGTAHIGASIAQPARGGGVAWQAIYQAQVEGKTA